MGVPSPAERREYPRVRERLSFKAGAISAQTDDLSCGGASCLLDRPIPPMTKLSMVIELPSSQPVRCTGVVLRQIRKDQPAGYQTALYFSDLQASDRKRIADFVLQSMFRHST
jgi:hypothetical protein